MAGDSKRDGEDVSGGVSSTSSETEMKSTKKKKPGLFSRTFNALFRSRKDDYEKRLEHISKEETAVLTRKIKRAQNWRRITRNFIFLSVLLEAVAVIYAVMTTRTVEMHWRIRAVKVSPMFLIPGLSFLIHSALSSLHTFIDRKDEKTLERLKSERQAKINELKEKTNYYITQQLIERYDTDPAAKKAAAAAIASKLGADSGMKFYMLDDSTATSTGQSADVEVVPSKGLRNRKKRPDRANSVDAAYQRSHEDEMAYQAALDGIDVSQYQQQLVVEHHPQTGSNASDGGWLARIAALLVGEDPTQSYALICGNCHMHNGLARKEDFPYITYYCPHCKALNKPKQTDQRVSESNSPHLSSSTNTDMVNTPGGASIGEMPPFSPSPGGSISEVPPSSPSATISSTLPAAATATTTTTESSSIVSDDPVG